MKKEKNAEAMADLSRMREAEAHKPGTRHQMPDGTEYVTLPNGAWERTTRRKCNKNAMTNDHHNNGVCRRRQSGM